MHWLAQLGIPGVFGAAVIDSSVVPMPIPGSTDLLLLWLISQRGNPWAMVACAVAGSLLGGYFTWRLGKSGGDAALRRYVPKRALDRTKNWAQGHPILAVFVPAILPPPIPLSPFLVAAGALKVSPRRFMAVFAAARALRYGFIGWLGVKYGRRVIHVWSAAMDKYETPFEWAIGILVAGGVLWGVWKYRRRMAQSDREAAVEPSASRSD